uniref:Retinoic acid receptor responder protein 2 n=1 Tax=Poecilia latipinna TaxID=48699 RepID=A0A3B3UYN2_9TELE
MAAGLLLLVCAGGLLLPAEAQDSYNQLPTAVRAGVDLALEQLTSHASVKHHFRFLKSVEKKERDEGFGVLYLYHNFHLRPTRCAKGTPASDSRVCHFRNDRVSLDPEPKINHVFTGLRPWVFLFLSSTASDGLCRLL